MWQSNFLTVLFFFGFFLCFLRRFAMVAAGLLCWSCQFTVSKSLVYCVEVTGLLCRSRLGLPPVYCVEVTVLLCWSRRFTVSKSPWFTASLLCWSRRFTVSKSPFYHVEVTILYGWSSFVGVLSCIASRDKVVWLSWYEVWWFFSAGNQNKKKASKKTLERGNESK